MSTICDDLRAAILQAAIQGKLTKQLPEDGSAEDILKEIKAEKEKLITEGKIKKQKPLAPITDDEIPFSIPDNWEWVRLGDITYNHGQKKPEKLFSYIDVGTLNNIDHKLNDKEQIVEPEKASSRARKIVHKGDVIYATIRPYLHNICIIDRDFSEEPIASTAFAVMSTYTGINNKYLFQALLSPDFDNYANRTDLSKGVAYPAIGEKDFFNGIIPLPPLAEQKRIVEKVDELMARVADLEQSADALASLKKAFPDDIKASLLQAAIQGKLTKQLPEDGSAEDILKEIKAEKEKLITEGKIKKQKPLAPITDDEIPFNIPDSWKWARLSELGLTQTGNTPSKTRPEYFGKDVPFIGPGDIKNGIINYDNQGISNLGKEVARVVPSKSILQVCIGGSIGKNAIANQEIAFNQQINSITPIICSEKYLSAMLNSNYFIDLMKEKAGGTATPILNRGIWDTLPIPLPPLSEQKRIVECLDSLMQNINVVEDLIASE